jgi:hypothetical protein
MPDLEKRVNEIDERIWKSASDWIKRRTIGLYRQMPGGNPVLEGSGVLLKIADVPFVVTCGHVLTVVTEGAAILIGPMAGLTKPGHFVALTTPKLQVSADAMEEHALVDVGFARLPDEAERELVDYGKAFTRLNELELGRDPKIGLYSVLGYPRGTNNPDHVRKVIEPAWYHYGSYLWGGEIDRFVQGISIAVGWTSEVVRNEHGAEIPQPLISGISGCGMWLLHSDHRDAHRLNTWTPDRIRLAGIEHRVLARKWIKGTVVREVVERIAQVFPELQPSIRLTTVVGDVATHGHRTS